MEMVRINDYRFVKYCRLCHKRFVVNRGERVNNYCDACIKRFKKEEKK
jgi:hypothetical protein